MIVFLVFLACIALVYVFIGAILIISAHIWAKNMDDDVDF